MADTFHRSIRYLQADDGRRNVIVLLTVGVLLGAWGAWLALGEVTVYAVSAAARLEVDRAAHPVETPVAGKVVKSTLDLDRAVEAGELLVELDSETEKLQLGQEKAYLGAISPQLEALQAELGLRQKASGEDRRAAAARVDEAKAQQEAGEAAAKLAQRRKERAAQLFDAGAVAEAELDQAASEAEQRKATLEALKAAPGRIGWERQATTTDRHASIQQLRRGAAYLKGEIRTTEAKIKRLQHEISRRRIVAAVAGRLGEVANVRVGQYLAADERLAVVVPEGAVHVVAEFDPGTALGRVQKDAKARLRLEGFPWTQYGTVPATVRSVGSELRSGTIRVELELHPGENCKVPVQHGLPGSVEVEVEHISPAVLVLRLAGKLLPVGTTAEPAPAGPTPPSRAPGPAGSAPPTQGGG